MTPILSNSQSISGLIEQLRSCCQVNIQSTWLYQESDTNLSCLQPVTLNEKEHIAWTGGKQVLWLTQKLVIPQSLQGYPLTGLTLRLSLVWWAEIAEIYVNGELVLEGDLFDCSPRVLLSSGVTPGEEFLLALRLVSPSHCDGALVRSLLLYESLNYHTPDPGFVADELAITQVFLQKSAPGKLVELDREIINQNHDDWENLLLFLRQKLIEYDLPNLKSKIYLLGHAHLDLAWLWRVSETWNAAQRTFESVLNLQTDFPELIFCHSTPALYAWIEEHRPDLFAQIQERVTAGSWEIIGGLWVEPELNLISGESIVRQLLYGQRYFQEKFGQISPVVWVPDTFGFCATLPQFFVNGGIEYFVTQKLRWNDTTKFDYGAFWWRSPDGSQIFSFMSAPIGESIEPVKMVKYACEWQTQTGLNESLWLPGVGDHGGGPTRDMLEVARRWQNSPILPELEFTTAAKYLQKIKSQSQNFPIWEDELYLEFHRGCYTSHADQKLWNRRCENLLYQAELFATLATVSCGVTYPKAEIETAWKTLLFQQFHDILPGSSITEVYEDALPEWEQVQEVGTKILETALKNIASQINLPSPPHNNSIPVIVFNSLNWQRSQVVTIALPPTENQTWQVHDTTGKRVPTQQTQPSNLLFIATVPSVGYNLYWLSPSSDIPTTTPTPKNWILENDYLRVQVNSQTGDLDSVFDKIQERETLSGAGNQLQAFTDSGQYWDAWNIDPNYHQHPLPPTKLKSIQWIEKGEITQCIRVVRQLGNSEFCQDYILETGSKCLKIDNTVNWQESQVLIKVAFPLNVEADFATYEIPCGAIRRSTNPQTPAEKAKWEVPALRWADLTENQDGEIYGVSLLNDCKYGYDSQPNQLRLTLLRSPQWPDAKADIGLHKFAYSLYPHAGSWEKARTVRKGYELNIPLQVVINPNLENNQNSTLSSCLSFLDLSADNLILMALKPTEDDIDTLILRCYECQGEIAELALKSDIVLNLGNSVDLLERFSTSGEEITMMQPWKIESRIVTTDY
ncbi:alpha-mannosidase [Cronbergia sp. UHCC 0137]|uniref:alpha-mannosidase n=1 Tax=Cronbergia sp. UHCC 0137 TaxID=3110239 RepID=UPI002B215A8C|nr:alpha-mannosidase [Cronbergia sp. UHCC 0137]MEA5617711.1 alpha-mannosidase [Cronbergia sp. UHCC 0137]